ncbi:MAG: hypothetical protein KDA69_10720 [Planctomycetaceae bacterium]|nr:hypothetical protein [Planctomycetaceae bacterium]MCA9044784.1 hypothetical protein [Planctomycetaceae bacterium]
MSARAALVAELLWELKKEDKVATYSAIAERAGFSAGTTGRSMLTCLKAIRRDWDHLQWWRAIPDNKTVEAKGKLAAFLTEWGATIGEANANGLAEVTVEDEKLKVWEEAGAKLAEETEDEDTSAGEEE